MEKRTINNKDERGAPFIPKIKICGITSEAEVEYLNEAKVEHAGFVFFEKSKRNISLEKANEIFKYLDPGIKKVAVMVSPDAERIAQFNETGFDIIQIHGELREEVLETVKKPVWRALNLKDISELDPEGTVNGPGRRWQGLSEKIKGIVLDAPNYGSGKTFDWSAAEKIKDFFKDRKEREFILAGGLNPENIGEGIKLFDPDIVDVSSGVEGERGKDKEKILKFVKAVRECNI